MNAPHCYVIRTLAVLLCGYWTAVCKLAARRLNKLSRTRVGTLCNSLWSYASLVFDFRTQIFLCFKKNTSADDVWKIVQPLFGKIAFRPQKRRYVWKQQCTAHCFVCVCVCVLYSSLQTDVLIECTDECLLFTNRVAGDRSLHSLHNVVLLRSGSE